MMKHILSFFSLLMLCSLGVSAQTPTTVEVTIGEDVKVGDEYYATFSSQYAVDFTDVEGLTAYTVRKKTTGDYSDTRGICTLTEVKKVPANAGVLLKATQAKSFTVPVAEGSVSALRNNDLKVLATATALTNMQTVKWGEVSKGPGILTTKTLTYMLYTDYVQKEITVTGFVMLEQDEVETLDAGTVYMSFDIDFNSGGAESEFTYPAYALWTSEDDVQQEAVEVSSIAELKAVTQSGEVKFNMTNVKVTYAKNDTEQGVNQVVIEDGTGAINVQQMADYLTTGDVLAGSLNFTVQVMDLTALGGDIVRAVTLTNASKSALLYAALGLDQGVTISKGTSEPTEITDDNFIDYIFDYEWRYVKFNGLSFTKVDGVPSVDIELFSQTIPLQDLWHNVDTWPKDGQKVNITGFLYSLYGTKVFQPVELKVVEATAIEQEMAVSQADARYIDAQGRVANGRTKGLIIRQERQADGSVKTVKVVR